MREEQGWPPDWPDISDLRVLAAMRAVPREHFVPSNLAHEAYSDGPLPIGYGQTISQPYMVALMTQALALQPGDRVLEVGTGSGYQAAILAQLGVAVWSIERTPELAGRARQRLAELGYAVTVKVGDGWCGWAEHAPFDAIIVTAAGAEPPPPLVQQLAVDGRLVIPIGQETRDQELWLIEKQSGRLSAQKLANVRFVPLVSHLYAPQDAEQERIRQALRNLMK